MGIEDTLLKKILIPRPRPINFRAHFKKTSRILITVSPTGKPAEAKAFEAAFQKRFKGKKTQLLVTGAQAPTKGPMINIGPAHQSLWTLWRHPQINTLRKQHFDLLIDIDPANRGYQFLCGRLNIPMRIALTKPQIDPYYNLEYSGRAQAPYAQRLEGLLDFLQQFV